MFAYSVPVDFALTSRHGHRLLRAALPQDAAGGLDPDRIVLAIHDEGQRARDLLEAKRPGTSEGGAGVRFYGEADLAGWPSWPTRLGRLAPDGQVGLALVEAPEPLPAQLAALRARHPGKRRFRIALVGAFGYNLGDTLIGATAWRILLPVLRAALPDVGADALFGPSAVPAVAELIGHEDGIDQVSFFGPSLLDFARYDAFFDFSGLVTLPRFHTMPALDWVLWWLGLDPDAVPPAGKRNRLRLPDEAVAIARERLAEGPARKKIAFVWRASTPLRSMPDDVAIRFAETLLAAAPEITLVTDRPLGLTHPRLLDLGAVADSAERMMALVAQADGLIAVDSLAPHVADAADLPAVMLLATLPPSRFPYYPRQRIVTPEGMEALPGWGVTKVSDEAWAGMRDDYLRAWDRVSAQSCWALLAESMAAAPRVPRLEYGPAFDRARGALPAPGRPFPYDVVAPHAAWIAAEAARFSARVLGPGRGAILAGGGDGSLALELARAVAPGGILHVLEPRRLRAQKLFAEAQRAGLDTLHLRPALAGATAGRRAIPAFDPAGEADPNAWGNLLRLVEADIVTLDGIGTEECRALVLAAPQPAAEALAGAAELLRRAGPLVVAGPVADAELPELARLLRDAAYRGHLSWPDRGRIDAALLLAVPAAADVRFEGFEQL